MTDNVDTDVGTNVATRIGGEKGISPGRKKGSKNKSTLLREALTNDFEEQLQKDFTKVVKVVMEQAISGCRQSQKLILDRVVPTVHAESDKDNKNKFAGGVSIYIGSLEDQTAIKVSPDTIEAEYEEIND